MTTTPHPDYHPQGRGNPHGDRCVCGGIRYWHAVHPHGCDDCDCTEFHAGVELPIRQSLADSDTHYRTSDRTIETTS